MIGGPRLAPATRWRPDEVVQEVCSSERTSLTNSQAAKPGKEFCPASRRPPSGAQAQGARGGAGMIVPFFARWPGGVVDRHELPLAVAVEFAAQLRGRGVTVVWAPLETPPAPPPSGPTRAERRADRKAERKQERQILELGMVA